MYRVIQFWRAITARIEPEELDAIEPLLGSSGMALFQRLAKNDQRHSLNVYATLKEQGHDDPDLLTASLLHDVGKTVGSIQLPYRIARTLLETFCPDCLVRLETGTKSSLLAPFRTARNHPEVGSHILAAEGFSRTVVELVRWHHETPGGPVAPDEIIQRLAALQQADSVN